MIKARGEANRALWNARAIRRCSTLRQQRRNGAKDAVPGSSRFEFENRPRDKVSGNHLQRHECARRAGLNSVTPFSLRCSRCQRLHSVLGYPIPRQYQTEFKPVIDRTTSSRQALDAGPEDRALLDAPRAPARFRRTAPCRSQPKSCKRLDAALPSDLINMASTREPWAGPQRFPLVGLLSFAIPQFS